MPSAPGLTAPAQGAFQQFTQIACWKAETLYQSPPALNIDVCAINRIFILSPVFLQIHEQDPGCALAGTLV